VVELAEVESAWEAVGEQLPQRVLLYMDGGGSGGHVTLGGRWADYIAAYDLPGGGCLYTHEVDVADLAEHSTSVIGLSQTTEPEVDVRVVGLALSMKDPRGLALANAALGGALDEMYTTLPRDRAVQLLVTALTEVGGISHDPDMEELAAQAPENLEPWGPEWKVWFVEEYFGPFLSD
jgi:hypothetical protein